MPTSPGSAGPRPPAVLRASSLEDLVSLVPHLLGFVPSESLVVGYLSGRRRRLGLTARFDLPPDADADGRREVNSRVVELATQVKADAAFVLVYADTDQGLRTRVRWPAAPLVEEMQRGLRRRRVAVIGPGLVSAGRLWLYDGSGPAGGRVLSPTPSGAALALAAESALGGRQLLASRDQLAASVSAHDRVGTDVFSHMVRQARAECAALAAGDGWQVLAVRTQQRVLAGATAAEAGRTPFEEDAAAMVLAALDDVRVRDAVLTLALDAVPPDSDEPEPGEGPGDDAPGLPSAAVPGGDTIFPSTPVDPAALLAACVDLASWSRGDTTAAGCALLGGVAYALHRGPLAGVAIERALDADPDYPLARLLLEAIEAALHPARLRAVLRAVRDELGLPPRTGSAAA